MKGVSLRSEEAHKAVVSIACYNRQCAISSLFRHLKSLMQIGNRQSQRFHAEEMGALVVYSRGFICQTRWSIFQKESNGRVCICVKWNGLPWVVSGIALMPEMLLCCTLLYVGHKTQLQLLDVTSTNPSPIWIQGCCLRRWPCCTNWQLTSWIGCKFIYKLKLRHKLLNSMLTSYFTSHDCGCQHCSFICMSSHELIRWRNCCLIFFRFLCFCSFGTFSPPKWKLGRQV